MNAAAANLLSHPRAAGETVPKLRRSPEEVAAAVMQDLSLRLCDAQEKLTKEELLLQKGPTPTKQLKVDAAKAKVDAIQQKLGAAQQKYIAARLKSVAKEEAALAKRQKLLDTAALKAGLRCGPRIDLLLHSVCFNRAGLPGGAEGFAFSLLT